MIFELRHYTAVPGRGDALLRRFTDHTFSIFAGLNFTLRDFWRETGRPDHLWYILEWRDDEDLLAGWQRLRDDPAWKEVKVASEADGPLVASIDSILLERIPASASGP